MKIQGRDATEKIEIVAHTMEQPVQEVTTENLNEWNLNDGRIKIYNAVRPLILIGCDNAKAICPSE